MEIIDRTIGSNIYGFKPFLGHLMALALIPTIVWLLVQGMKKIRIGKVMSVVTVISLVSAYRAGDLSGLISMSRLIKDIVSALRPLLSPKVLQYLYTGFTTVIDVGGFMGGLLF